MTTTRRGFLGRLAGGTLGIAAAPIAELFPSSASALAAPAPPPWRARLQAPDEAYWRQVKAQFPLRDDIVPLNAANLCPSPRQVIDAVTGAMRDLEGDVSFQNRAKFSDVTEAVRARLGAYLGATADEIAIVRNTSEGNNNIVGGLALGAGDEVVLFDENHPTNAVAWDVRAARYGFTVRRVTVPPPAASPAQVLDTFRRALTPRTRVLAFSDVSNTSGLRLPTRELCALGRERSIHVHVDGAQTFGALVRDLHDLGCDSYAASAHKWFMGPKEAGVLFVRADRIPHVWPGMVGVGWGDGPETTATGARKLETLGQRNDATIVGIGAALDFHELIGPAIIEARVLELADVLKRELARLPGARLVTPTPPELGAGVVIVQFEGRDMGALYRHLYADHRLAGASTGGLRLCPHIYTTMADIERTVSAVTDAVAAA